jgi:lipopolysaccharide biosynthesis regulator YciM
MTLLIIIVVALIALVLYLYFYRKREKVTGYGPYIEALVALLENDEDTAMKKFKEAVSLDSDLIDAYIRLGDLYRKRGDISRAIQIHQSLTVRPTLKKQKEKRVYYALVNDLLDANRHNKAIAFLKEILKIDKKDKHARELVLRIYEEMSNYGDCITFYEDGVFKPRVDKRHAFYYASFANDKLKKVTEENPDEEKEAINLLKKALRISANSLTALYYLANHFEQKGDLKKAKEYFYKIIKNHPDHAFLIIPKFEKIYFELDLFDEIIPIYEKIFRDNPKNFTVGFVLADLYEKKNDIETAKDLYYKLADVYPVSILPKLHLLKANTDDETLKEKIAKIENIISHGKFKCTKCAFSTEKFSFLCPKCHAIESFLSYL